MTRKPIRFATAGAASALALAFSALTASADETAWQFDGSIALGLWHRNGVTEGYGQSSGTFTLDNQNGLQSYLNFAIGAAPDAIAGGLPESVVDYTFGIRKTGLEWDWHAALGTNALTFGGLLFDELPRRGLLVETSRAGNTITASAFVTRASDALDSENLSGLSERDDRITGAAITLRPATENELSFTLAGYEGRGAPTPGDIVGAGSGYALDVQGNAAEGRLGYAASFAEVDWDADAELAGLPLSAQAVAGFVDMAVSNDRNETYLSVEYQRVETDFVSLAQSELDPGLESLQLRADFLAGSMSLATYAEITKTNIAGPDTEPTDRLIDVTLDGAVDFDGVGFWNSRQLTFGFGLDRIDRLVTPFLAPPPQDATTLNVYLGYEWRASDARASLSYDVLIDDDRSALDADSKTQTLSLWAERDLNEFLTVGGSIAVSSVTDDLGKWVRSEAEGFARIGNGETPHAFDIAFGVTSTNEPLSTDGIFAEIAYDFAITDRTELALKAAYLSGPYAEEFESTEERVVGIELRRTLGGQP